MTFPDELSPAQPQQVEPRPDVDASPLPVRHVKAPGSRLVALLLASAALVAAVLAARASFLSNDANGLWQKSLRQEVKSAAATVESIRFTYTDEARQSYRVAVAKVREDEFRKAAAGLSGPSRDAVLFEADVQAKVVSSILASSEIASDPRYALPGGAYDVILRLADTRAKDPDIVAIDPDRTLIDGDRPAGKAVAMMASTVPVGVAFMLGALGQAFVRRRRLLLTLGAGALVGAVILAVAVELAL